jgi:hypothetical protein
MLNKFLMLIVNLILLCTADKLYNDFIDKVIVHDCILLRFSLVNK